MSSWKSGAHGRRLLALRGLFKCSVRRGCAFSLFGHELAIDPFEIDGFPGAFARFAVLCGKPAFHHRRDGGRDDVVLLTGRVPYLELAGGAFWQDKRILA